MPDDLSLDLFGEAEGEEEEAAGRTDAGDAGPAIADASPTDSGPVRDEPPPKVWSVSQVNRAVRGLLESSVEPLWVGGEVGSWTRSRPGHCYFTLKDEKAQLRAVMFSREAQHLPTDPDEGMKVRVLGDLTLYEARGEYQMVVRRLEADGAEGLWRLAFEKLRAKLDAEGLLDPGRKRPLPRYPRCVGVVTSPTGAAFHDITSVLARRAPWSRVLLSGTRVQGEGASVEIAAALERLAATGLPDVIIVGRGGGSVEDLWAFNEEAVARAIAACPIPVVSAVGHEVDVTISDLVADHRAPTPSAAAESVAPDAAVLVRQLQAMPERLGSGLRRSAMRRRTDVADRLERLGRVMEGRLGPVRQGLDHSLQRLERRTASLLDQRKARLDGLAGRLDALSPLATLGRGYSVARAADGRVLRTTADLEEGTSFRLRVSDGTIGARSEGRVNDDDG